MNNNVHRRQKKILYNQVYILIVIFAAKVWMPDLKLEYQFSERLETTECYSVNRDNDV